MPVIEGGLGTPLSYAGAPVAGTNEVQTLTIGGTPTGGTFTLTLEGAQTAAITWVNVNATLLAAMNTAMDAAWGTGAVVAAAGTLTAGIGTITLTFGANRGKQAIGGLISVTSALTGTSPTLAVAETTPGVDATGRGSPKGALLIDVTNGILYINTGTALSPTYTKVGTQT